MTDKQLALYSISELFREANKKLQALPDAPDRLKNKVTGLSLKIIDAIDDQLHKDASEETPTRGP
ncbi:hypothetical protein [Mesorhizobium sp. P5_C1]